MNTNQLKMNNKFFSSLLLALFLQINCWAQVDLNSTKKIPSVVIRTVYGQAFNTSDIKNDGKPIILCFWKTCCSGPIIELSAINEVYANWQKETGVKLVAVSVDDSRNSAKILPFVNGQNWDYEILLDPNSDFKRAINVTIVPHTFIINGEGNIVWQKASFMEGDENEMYEVIKSISKN